MACVGDYSWRDFVLCTSDRQATRLALGTKRDVHGVSPSDGVLEQGGKATVADGSALVDAPLLLSARKSILDRLPNAGAVAPAASRPRMYGRSEPGADRFPLLARRVARPFHPSYSRTAAREPVASSCRRLWRGYAVFGPVEFQSAVDAHVPRKMRWDTCIWT